MANTKAVFFDFDGVLVNSAQAWFHTFNDALQHYGKEEVSYETFTTMFGNSIENDLQTYFKGLSKEELTATYNHYYAQHQGKYGANEQATLVLSTLAKKNIRLVLVTNATRGVAITMLKSLQLFDFFEVIITGDDVNHGKPSPEGILKAIEQLNISPQEVLFVGDTETDKKAAIQAGVRFHHYWIMDKKQELRSVLDNI